MLLAHFLHRKGDHLWIICLEARGPFQTAEAHLGGIKGEPTGLQELARPLQGLLAQHQTHLATLRNRVLPASHVHPCAACSPLCVGVA